MQKPGSNSTSSTTNDVVDDDTKTIYNIRKRKKPDYSSIEDVKDGYQFPRKSIKPKIPKANASIGTDINRYSAIADDSEDSDMETSQIPEKEATQTKFTGNAKTPTPPPLIIKGVETKLRNLNKIKYVNHTKITWERKLSKKKIIQCKNCQQWGHATSNCHSVPNCLKCGEEHATKDCTMAPDSTPKCANCRGPHIASSDDCPVYLYRLTKVKRPFDTQMSQVPCCILCWDTYKGVCLFN